MSQEFIQMIILMLRRHLVIHIQSKSIDILDALISLRVTMEKLWLNLNSRETNNSPSIEKASPTQAAFL